MKRNSKSKNALKNKKLSKRKLSTNVIEIS
nr:MAG TPA: hypothetical protein [Caudoviricetes sp.]